VRGWLWNRRPLQAERLQVELDLREFRRGETVHATLRVPDPSAIEHKLQFGLLCVERVDIKTEAATSLPGGTTSRYTVEEYPVYEDWHSVAPRPEQSLDFTIPPDGYCSYEGQYLTYAWRVSAREVRGVNKRQRGHRTDIPIWVLR
jgi:hypothetical protein